MSSTVAVVAATFRARAAAAVKAGALPIKRLGCNVPAAGLSVLFPEAGCAAARAAFSCACRGQVEQRNNPVVVIAFSKVIESAVFNGLHAIGDIAVGGKQYNFGKGRNSFQLCGELHAIAIGEFHIAQGYGHRLPGNLPEGRFAVARLHYLKAFQTNNADQQGNGFSPHPQ